MVCVSHVGWLLTRSLLCVPHEKQRIGCGWSVVVVSGGVVRNPSAVCTIIASVPSLWIPWLLISVLFIFT